MTSLPTRTVDVAGLGVDLVGDHPVIDALDRELGATGPLPVLGTITFHLGPPPLGSEARTIGTTTWSDDRLLLAQPRTGFTLELPIEPDADTVAATVWVEDRPMPLGLPRPLFRWAEPTNLDPVAAQAYMMIHDVLESVLFFHRAAVPLHASVLSDGTSALALTSAGGVGKTSTSLALMGSSSRWTLLSDDMTMLRPGEIVHAHRRWPMIYDYNLVDNPAIADSVRGRGGALGRAQWALARPVHRTKRRRRLPAAELGSAPVDNARAPLAMVGFLFRHPGSELTVQPVGADELARRSTAILAIEFAHLFDGLRLAEALGAPPLVGPLLDAARADYEARFTAVADLVDIGIPASGTTAGDVARFVQQRLSSLHG